MKTLLTPETAQEVAHRMTQALTDTFKIVFCLDVFLLPQSHGRCSLQTVSAHIDMTDAEAKGVLAISMTQDLADHLAKHMDPHATSVADELVQDIICEIVNIVGNHARSFLHDKKGINLAIGLPKTGFPFTSGSSNVNLNFHARENNDLYLGFQLSAAEA